MCVLKTFLQELAMSIKNEGDYIPQHDGAFDDIKPSAFASHGEVFQIWFVAKGVAFFFFTYVNE